MNEQRELEELKRIIMVLCACEDCHICKKEYPNYLTELTQWSLEKQNSFYEKLSQAILTSYIPKSKVREWLKEMKKDHQCTSKCQKDEWYMCEELYGEDEYNQALADLERKLV
jgi:hypothetical protein